MIVDETLLLPILAIYLVLAGLVALIAPSRGKSPLGAFLISILLSPLIGFLVVVLLPSETTRSCPHCGESIKKAAIVCRYCGRDVVPETMARSSQQPSPDQPSPQQPSPGAGPLLLIIGFILLIVVGGWWFTMGQTVVKGVGI
jgi:hypothetical protein